MKKLLLIAALALAGWVGLGSVTAEAYWPRYYAPGYVPVVAYHPYLPYSVQYNVPAYNPYYSNPYSYNIGWNPYYRFSYVEYPGGYVIGPTGGGAFFRSPLRR